MPDTVVINDRFNLTGVTYPDQSTKTYHYTDQDGSGAPRHVHLLTGITDENGAAFSTYAYDQYGRVTLSERAGGAGRITLNYTKRPGESENWTITEVTRPLGEVVTYDMGSTEERTTETDWDDVINRVTELREPGRTTTFTYSGEGQLLTKTITDTATGANRVWTYTYCDATEHGGVPEVC